MASTMANKKNNKRKFVAVGLALVGIAGLSAASAAQLTVDTTNEVAIGSGEFQACADAAFVDYDYDGRAINTLTVSNLESNEVAVDCNGLDVTVSLEYTPVGGSATTVDLGTTQIAQGAAEFAVTPGIDLAADLGEVTVIIG